ncbi:Zn-finger protein joined to JAZF1 (predicted suppressor) [Plasmopara halstedii]|uniref:Zn-finger protein joined to JAZF1 (Predicted suppressor) n=1 Tax=Plasmopara halstedii TaxID=4781 RepID=A0A0P1A7R1_PLAHL|nr:Zn-finger protein joined to JAZF1 (predicted suppressor) [Plasmopara halstedii]CEG36313.1 Zn-finger protein joined to JAZF1 (predicted suppressor) [Plasmopara halstedii]|eukprot:XP_024572682.1 Zn-finger protein joined to JAZF1 (predicted suppressor) [Plasmopara halstedii]
MVDAVSNKRKRDTSHERKPALHRERHAKVRQEHMEHEFAETYHGLTALYKLLEVKHLQSPLFLPRTLSYRLNLALQKSKSRDEEDLNLVKRAHAGATLKNIKFGMTSETLQTFKSQKLRPGVVVSLYKAKGKAFADNQFTLLATCLIPVPCSKDVILPKKFVHLDADICIAVFHVIEIKLADAENAAQSVPVFEAPKVATIASGKDLMATCSNGCKPLFGNILRLNVSRRRTGYVTIELPAIPLSVNGGVKCELQIIWDPLPKTKKMRHLASICNSNLENESEDKQIDENFKLALPRRKVASTYHKPGSGVWFHFLYHAMLRRMSEKRSDYSCAWCNMFAGSLRGLVAHLVSSHDRFRFQATVGHDHIPHIYVMVMQEPQPQKGNSSRRSAFYELEMFPSEKSSRFEHQYIHMSRKKYSPYGIQAVEAVEDLMQEFEDIDELSLEQPQEFYAPLLQRQYFHSRTGAVVLDHEKDYDSDDDVDETWITKQSERLLDEFEDVSLEEKEFMKKWNRHVKEFKILADFMVASSCRMFARKHGKWLLEHGLRHNFLLHLLNLWDNSLLNSRAIIDCMLIVDQNVGPDVASENGQKAVSQSEGESLPLSENLKAKTAQ